MMDSFLTVPVVLEFKNIPSPFLNRRKIKLKEMYQPWKATTLRVPNHGPNYAILTGYKSGITVIDVDYKSNTSIDNTEYMIATPSSGLHYYFQYESKLQSIYDTLDGVSVLNDNRFVFAGEGYTPGRNRFIPKMPEQLFSTLLQRQEDRPSIDDRLYELLMILSDEWFLDPEKYIKIIHAFRNNTLVPNQRCIDTIRAVLVEKFDYRPKEFIESFDKNMNWKEKRYILVTLCKEIKADYPTEYEIWYKRWKDSKPNRKPKMVYKDGAYTKFSELKANYRDGELTTKLLLTMNPRWTSSRLNICKSCTNRHLKGCCDQYSLISKTSALYIKNVALEK